MARAPKRASAKPRTQSLAAQREAGRLATIEADKAAEYEAGRVAGEKAGLTVGEARGKLKGHDEMRQLCMNLVTRRRNDHGDAAANAWFPGAHNIRQDECIEIELKLIAL